ncbi:M48 family metalloprotease [Streptacidiphilus fuscans]|uniref:M48 family metalloprotease n=1 Tax=Streptacidiphilus fuscans TaxID=2789292 RepID=A0A931B163_9ACTN|nr:M56 family metallopeptidase [Streptacidiphilus fuscans]MBF9067267.1 M48 family metalloprotease [Streptacidiphilus fuscans]
MSADIKQPPYRVDEREIAAGTTTRFIQLVALLVISSASLLSTFWQVTTSPDHFSGLGCLLAAGFDVNSGDVASNYVPLLTHNAELTACYARYEPAPPVWGNAVWPLAMVLLAGLLTLLLPKLTRRWRHLMPLAEVDPSGKLREAAVDAAARAGLVRPPELVFDPFSRGNGAMVFGRDSHPILCLDADLVAALERDRTGFDAVLLHELAHIRNRDVTVSTATLAVWRVYLLLVALPGLGLNLWQLFSGSLTSDPFWSGEWPTVIRDLVYPILLTALAFLSRADVLRAREMYADRTARRWGASEHAWERPESGTSGFRRLLHMLRDAGRSHPRLSLRRSALAGPEALFRINPLQMFLAGAAAIMIAADSGIYLSDTNDWIVWGPALLAAAAAIAVAGVALWRAVAYAVLNDLPGVPSGISAGLWFGAGLAFAEWETGQLSKLQFVPSRPWLGLVVLCAGIGFCWWMAVCARLWLTVWPGADKRPALALMLVAAGLLATAWLYWWSTEASTYTVGLQSVRTLTEQVEQAFPGKVSAHRGLLHALALLAPVWVGWNGTLNVLADGVLWLVPLIGIVIGAVRRRPTADIPGGSDGRGPSLARPIAWALTVGAVTSIGGIAVAKAAMHSTVPAPDRFTALFAVMTLSWICVAIVFAAVAAAAIAAALVPWHRLPVALVAATGTTAFGLVATFFTESADGCVRPLADSMDVCVWVPSAGWSLTAQLMIAALSFSILAAFATAFVVSAVAKLNSRFREPTPRPSPHAHDPGTRRHVVRVIGAAIVVLVAIGATAIPTARAIQIHSSPVSSQTLDEEAQTADTPTNEPKLIRAFQLTAWYKFGGGQILQQWSQELGRFGRHLGQAVTASPSGILSTQWVSTLMADCRDLDRSARAAEAYFPVPDSRLQLNLAQAIAEAANAASTCTKSLQQGDGPAFMSAVSTIPDSVDHINAAYSAIKTETDEYARSN